MFPVLCLLFMMVFIPFDSFAEPLFQGEISLNYLRYDHWQSIIRYRPEVFYSHSLGDGFSIDGSCAVSLEANTKSLDGDLENEIDVSLYRGWFRLSESRFELRIGIQKISFGSSKFVRSLMWFDNIDPLDPLKLTEGVRGILGRYYFRNNANGWVWCLYDNEERKGLERFSTGDRKFEWGGRLQYPVPRGEVGMSYHHRPFTIDNTVLKDQSVGESGKEERVGFDGMWDVGIGFWLESSLSMLRNDGATFLYETSSTTGVDYTISVGSGLHLLAEHLYQSTGEKFASQSRGLSLSLFSVDASVTLLDSVSALFYVDWNAGDVYPFLSWQRTYDNILLHTGFFSFPENSGLNYQGDGFTCLISLTY